MKTIVAILIAVCLAHVKDVSAKVKVLSKSHVSLENTLVFNDRSYDNERLTYALCDKNPSRDEVKCTVIREKKPYSDDSYSCNVTLKRESGKEQSEPRIAVIPFGKHNVVIYSWETSTHGKNNFLRFTVVQLDSCKVNEVKIDTTSELSPYFDYTIVSHDDSFDVFFRNSKDSCAGKTCKATIDSNGKLSKPIPSMERFVRAYRGRQSIVSLEHGSSAKGYVYVKEDQGDYEVRLLMKSNGTEKVLVKHGGFLAHVAISTKNNLIGVCYQTTWDYKCFQHDFDGNLKLQADIPLKYPANKRLGDVYNLPDGGFYVLTRVCSKHVYVGYVKGCYAGIDGLEIERIDANGAKSGLLTIQVPDDYLSSEYIQVPLFYENESKETCMSLAAYENGDRTGPAEGNGHLYLTASCFTDADFSK